MPLSKSLALTIAALLVLVLSILPAQAWPPEGAKSLTAMYGDVPIHYLDMGQGGLPLVFIHGWACRTDVWRGQVPLAQEGRVIMLDSPGQGLSGPLDGEYSMDRLGQAVLAVMDQAGIERAILVGHSMGASVAWRAAVAAPDRVAGLVSMDGALFVLPEDEQAREAWIQQMRGLADELKGPEGEARTVEFIDTIHGPETPAALKDEILEIMMATPRQVRLSLFESMADPTTWDNKVFAAPTLGIYVQSPDLPPDYEQIIRTVFPDFTFVLLNGPGHFVMMERPEQVNQLIRDFRDRLAQ